MITRLRSLTIAGAALCVLAVNVPNVHAKAARDPEGLWRGTIQSALRLVLHVERDASGKLKGSLDSPDQSAMGLGIDELTFAGDTLRLVMKALGAGYVARMSDDGKNLIGTWSQSGTSLPLTFARTDQPIEIRRPQEPHPPFPYRSEEVRFTNQRDGIDLAGTLTLPDSGGPFPAVILLTGSGPENRDEEIFGHKPFLVLADHLTRHGIAVLRSDDRGVGRSTGHFARATSDDFANDALAGVAWLKTRPEIDARRIGLIGHSEGGVIAPLAARRSKDIAFLVLLAGPGVPGDSLLLLQNAAILESFGIGGPVEQEQVSAMRRVLVAVRGDADSLTLFRRVRELVDTQLSMMPMSQRAAAGNPDSMAAGATRLYRSPWMRYLVHYDPDTVLGLYPGPVLALNGGRDVQVPPKENLAGIERVLAKHGNRDVTVRELPGLNHLFQHCATCTVAEYGQIEETMAPEALDAVTQWITARTPVKR